MIEVRPLTPARWPDLEAIFNAKGCSMARGCWCMDYRWSGRHPARTGETRATRARKELRALSSRDPAPGLIGYAGDVPVGWVSLGPREDFAKLKRSPIMKPVDDRAVWSIICFVVPPVHRKKGFAKQLLAGAIAYAKTRGARLLEAYPVDLSVTPSAESLWFGTTTMYDDAGFREVARRKPARPVMRLELGTR